MGAPLACSDCYADSATTTFVVFGVLAGVVAVAILVAIALRRRRGLRRRGLVAFVAIVAGLAALGVLLPAAQVSASRSQPTGGAYTLVCGSAIHASLQHDTARPPSAQEASDDAFCARWGRFDVRAGETSLGAAAVLSLAFLVAVYRRPSLGRRRLRPAS